MKNVIIAVVLLAGAGLFYNFKLADSKPDNFKVDYRVTCSSCTVHYADESGAIQEEEVTGNWSKSLTVQSHDYVGVNARSGLDQTTTASVEIHVEGELVGSDASDVPYRVPSTAFVTE